MITFPFLIISRSLLTVNHMYNVDKFMINPSYVPYTLLLLYTIAVTIEISSFAIYEPLFCVLSDYNKVGGMFVPFD